MKEILQGQGSKKREIGRENIVATRTEIVSKFKRNIFKDHSPRILPRKDFFDRVCLSLLSYYL